MRKKEKRSRGKIEREKRLGHSLINLILVKRKFVLCSNDLIYVLEFRYFYLKSDI